MFESNVELNFVKYCGNKQHYFSRKLYWLKPVTRVNISNVNCAR